MEINQRQESGKLKESGSTWIPGHILIGLLAFLIAGILSSSCNSENVDNNPVQVSRELSELKYNIFEDTEKRDIKRMLRVKLERRISRDILSELSLNLKKQIDDIKSYKMVYFFFYVDDYEDGWAIATFNPDFSLDIMGWDLTRYNEMAKKAEPEHGWNIIGSWLYPPILKVTLFYRDGKLFKESFFGKKSKIVEEMTEQSYGDGKKIEEKGGNSHDEYYILMPDGNLEFWSEDGRFYTAEAL